MQLLHWTSNRAQVSDLTLTPPQSPRRFFSPSAASPSTSLVDDTNSSTLSPSPGLPILLPTPLSETAVANDLDYAAGLLDVEQKLATIKQLQLVHDHAAKLEAQKRRCLQRIAEIETTLPYAWSPGHGTKAKHQILSVDPHLSTCDDKRNTSLAARHFQCDITAAFLEHHKHDLKNDWREKEAASNLILYSPDLASLAAKPNGTVVAFETGLHLLGHIAEALTWRYADRACRMYRLDDQVLLPIALDLWDLPEERHRFAAALPLARKCLHQVLADRQRNVRYVSRFLHFLDDACVIHSARLIGQSLHQLNVDRIGKKLAPLPQELCDKITCLASDLDSRPSMRGTTSDLNHLKQLLLLDLRSAYAPWPTDNYTGCDPHYPCQCRKGNRLLRTDGPNVIWSLGARAFVHVHSRKTKSGRAVCVSDGRVCEGHQYGPLTKTKEPKLKMMKRKISQKFADGTNEQWEMSFMDWHLLGELISPHGWSFSWKTIC